MTLENPPIQEVTTDKSGYFPQVWVRWFQLARITINQKVDLIKQTRTITSSATLTTADQYVFCDASGGAITVTLPTAAEAKGLILTIKKINTGASNVTVDASGSETIDKSATQSLTGSSRPSITIISDGTEWWEI
jgi:hypothetical protein